MNRDTASVTRYALTHLGRDGTRTLLGAAQGRNTYATEAEARAHLADLVANNTEERLREVYGLPLEVRPCDCWPGHFDPKGIWFDLPATESPPAPAPPRDEPPEDAEGHRLGNWWDHGWS